VADAGVRLDLVEAAGAAPVVDAVAAAAAEGGAAGAAPTAVSSAGQPGRAALQQPVAIALGIVMHRYSLKRGAALARLEQLAAQEGRDLVESCSAFVTALEQLSLPD
jgi:response regulator NasT